MLGSVKTYQGPTPVKDTVLSEDSADNENHLNDYLNSKAESSANIQMLLMNMDAQQREDLLAETFEQDLKTLIKRESEQGYNKGLERGLKEAQKQTQALHNEQQKIIDEALQKLASLIDSVNSLTPQVQLKDNDIYDVITLAVFRLLGERLEQGDYLKQALGRATQEYLLSKKVVLCLSTEDYEFLHKHLDIQLQTSIHEGLQIREDKQLTIGNTRLELVNGTIEANFSEKLQLWCSNLAQLKRTSNID